MKQDRAKQAAEILLSIKAVTLSPEEPYTYSSGIKSPIYTDCRVLMSFPRERTQIRDLYIEMIKESDKEFDVIGGTATAGIPHAAWIAEEMKLPMLYVRGKAKDHGKGRQIEGNLDAGQQVAIIEDLISTGSSSAESVEAVRTEKGAADDIFAITTYGLPTAMDTFREHHINLHTLTNFETIVQTAVEKDYMKEKDIELVLNWAKNSHEWGK